MIPVTTLKQWLDSLPDTADVGVDDGGLNLLAVDGDRVLDELEIGGVLNLHTIVFTDGTEMRFWADDFEHACEQALDAEPTKFVDTDRSS